MSRIDKELYDLLNNIGKLGLTLRTDGETLNVSPAKNLKGNPRMVDKIKENKFAIIKAMQDHEEMMRTGVIQTEIQAFTIIKEMVE